MNKYKIKKKEKQHICKCGESDERKFYKCKNKIQSLCKTCFNQYCNNRWINKKKRGIKFLGGKCHHCKLETDHYAVYDFHHIKGTLKSDLDWSKIRRLSWFKIEKELMKCILLCANCHRIEHEGDFNHNYHAVT